MPSTQPTASLAGWGNICSLQMGSNDFENGDGEIFRKRFTGL